MTGSYDCPYLTSAVERSEDRLSHILRAHPELAGVWAEAVASTLRDPDQIRKSRRSEKARLFSKWYKDLLGGKHVVIVVVSDVNELPVRHWIVTAYVTRRLAGVEVEWMRS